MIPESRAEARALGACADGGAARSHNIELVLNHPTAGAKQSHGTKDRLRKVLAVISKK